MADGVNIPVNLDVTDIQLSDSINFKGIERDVSKQLTGLRSAISEVFNSAEFSKASNATKNALGQMERSLAHTEDRFKQYKKAVEDAAKSNPEYADALKKVSDAMKKAEGFETMYKLAKDAKNVEQATEYAKKYAEAMREVEQAKQNADPSYFAPAGESSKIEAMAQAYNRLTSSIGQTNAAAKKYFDTLPELPKSTSKFTTAVFGLSSAVRNLFGILKTVGNLLKTTFVTTLKVSVKVISTVVKGFKRAISAVRSFASGIKNLISKFGQLGKHGGKTTNDLVDGFKKLKRNVLMFGFGFRTAYFAIKRLRRIFVDAFKTMAAQFPELNKQLNTFTMALNRLKGSLGTMFQPIISVAIPILVKFMEYLSKAMEGVASFFAVLTGQSVIYKAISNQEDYAASLDKTAKAEKNARKEHEKTIASYDKLEVIKQDKNTGTGSGTDNEIEFPLNVTYKKAKVDKAISEFAKMIKKAWAEQDFSEVGEYLTQKVMALLNFFQNTVLPKITNFVNRATASILTFVNSFDFTAVGKKLGNIINDLLSQLNVKQLGAALASIRNMFIRFFDGLVTGIDWAKAGTTIANGVLGFLQELDIKALVHSVYTLINGIADAVSGFVGAIDWKDLAIKFYKHLEDLFTNIDIDKVANAIFDPINAIIVFTNTFVSQINWDKLSKDITKGIQKLFGKLDAKKLIRTITSLVNGLTKVLRGLIRDIPWNSYAKELAAGLNDLINDIDWNEIGAMLGDLVGGAFDFVVTAIKNTDWNQVGQSLSDLLNSLCDELISALNTIDWYSVGKAVFDLLAGIDWGALIINLFNLILGLLLSLGEILLGFIEPLFESLGAELESEFAELWESIKNAWNSVVVWFDGIIQRIINFFVNLWAHITTGFNNCVQWIKDTWNSIVNWFNTTVETIKSFFTDLKDNIKKKFNQLWENIKETWGKVVNWFKDNITQPLKDKFDNFKTSVKNTFTNLWNDVKNIWNSAPTWYYEHIIQPVETFFSNMWAGITTGAQNVWDRIREIFGKVTSWLDTNIVQPVRRVINGMISFVEGAVNGIIRGINKLIKGVNKISFNIPDWVPIFGGKTFGFNIPEISELSIPRLAQGAVIPPNKQFLAMLGDQSSGTNIEAPLETIKQALKEAMTEKTGSPVNQPIILQVDGKTVAKVVWSEEEKRYKQTGRYTPYMV